MSYMPPSKRQQHITPQRIWDIIKEKWNYTKEEFYDPFPINTPYKSPIFFNGLYGNWKKLNYVNSPFAKEILEQAVLKAFLQNVKHGNNTIMLLPTKTDQDWFHDIIVRYKFEIIWIKKRLKFVGNKHHATDTHFLVMIS